MEELFLFYFLSVLSVGDALAVGAASSRAFPCEARLLSLLMKTDGLATPVFSVFHTAELPEVAGEHSPHGQEQALWQKKKNYRTQK